ncbi:osmoprotectant transport system permease protein [Alkalibacter saccharofermentans DSM 14828]|uniref:Osmoprotectant transport system permease protein n=1 Tax=Alkalibacter saccharofermentans DSM 14828 TaxID=1120975 RepID=A0A1M4WN74_9FIRM|nr:osmoprotectant transport system permease protein [Alkalibacter saccharofermentans DSM 14828]
MHSFACSFPFVYFITLNFVSNNVFSGYKNLITTTESGDILKISGVFDLYMQRTEFFTKLFIEHIYLTSVAVLIITVVGLSTGILMTSNKRLASVVLTLTGFLYTIPSIALFGFLVAVTGIGNTSAIIALSLYGVLPIIRNTYVGITEVDPEIIESATAMGSTPLQLLVSIQLPLASPVIIAGFRTMVIMTIALGGIASFIGAGGLGVAIWRGITTNFPEMTVAGSLLVALFAIISDVVLGFVEKGFSIKVLGK